MMTATPTLEVFEERTRAAEELAQQLADRIVRLEQLAKHSAKEKVCQHF